MTDCSRIRANAAGVCTLPEGDAERDEAWAHARGCPACARVLSEAGRLWAVLGAASASRERAWARGVIVSELRREARSRMAGAVVAVFATFAAFVALAPHRSTSGHDWAFALATATCAAALGGASRRWPLPVLAVTPAIAAGVALATGVAGALRPSVGMDCVATEIACSAAVIAAARLVLRRGTSSLAPGAAAAGAAAGALAGLAALQLTCPEHRSLPHVLVFHVLGLAWAAAGAGAICRAVEPARHA